MGWSWGWPIQWCLAMGGADFCRFCLVVNRAFYQLILHKSPTFIGGLDAAAVPHMGLTGAELTALASEGEIIKREQHHV